MIKELTDKNYTELIDVDKNIFIDFYSPTCGPCQILKSFLPKIAEFAESNNTVVYSCDISKNPKISGKYMIRSVPFTCIVKKDKSISNANIGLESYERYISMIEKENKENKGFFSKFFK